jgi:hypothetical protein
MGFKKTENLIFRNQRKIALFGGLSISKRCFLKPQNGPNQVIELIFD